MAISNKAKQYIAKNKGKKSVKELAADLNLNAADVKNFIDTLDADTPVERLPPQRKVLFTTLALLIPVIFFVSLEVTLRLTNYRGNTDLFITLPQYDQKYTITNPQFAKRYFFYTSVVPNPPFEPFYSVKPENGYRVFVMGESSAAGYPYGFNGVPGRVVKNALTDIMPDKEVEVITVATSAINSYTLYDQVDEILRHKPDAILIYTGHNEFYGALGAGSNESLGNFPGFVRMYLKIQRLRTFMYLRDRTVAFSKWMAERRSESSKNNSQTLMQQVVRDQAITLDSPVYELGKHQFRSNMSRILDKFDRANVPVYLGSLASNLKDHTPFESIATVSHPPANEVYVRAKALYADGNVDEARVLFQQARDLDALKFRATTDFNDIIRELATKPNVTYVPVKEHLSSIAENEIIGFDLMLEHLHPNDKGYFHLGWAFFEAMKNHGFANAPHDLSNLRPHDYYYDAMQLTELDHRIVFHRLKVLTESWPFVRDGSPVSYIGYQFTSVPDSLAFQVVNNKLRWEQAKVAMGEYYLGKRNYDGMLAEFKGLMRDQYYNDSPFLIIAQMYLDRGLLVEAQPYLERAHALDSSAFTFKMMGAIQVHIGNFDKGIEFLETSLELAPRDAQALFNLSGAYAQRGDLQEGFEISNQLIEVNPNFPGAQQWHAQLTRILQQRGLLNRN